MPEQITTHMVNTYRSGLRILAQQKQSKLFSRVSTSSDMGENVFMDGVGPIAPSNDDTRFGDTKYAEIDHWRRRVFSEEWHIAVLKSRQDMTKLLNDPGGAYTRSMIAGMNRTRDTNIINGMLGSAWGGKEGVTEYALPDDQKIPVGDTGFTLAKVRTAMKKMKLASVDESDDEFSLNIAWTAHQEEQFLQENEVASIDYNTQKVLVRGGMGEGDMFYGFNYVRVEDWKDQNGTVHRILPKSGTTRSCVAWVNGFVGHNTWRDIDVMVEQLPTKKYAWQHYTDAEFGTVRIEDTGVVQFKCLEN